MTVRWQHLAVLGLMLVFVALNFLSIGNLALTIDENEHYRYGKQVLTGDSARFDDSKMPVSALNALPARLADFLPDGSLKSGLQAFSAARMMTVLFSALVAFMVFTWARQLYGFAAGLAALTLYVFDPNILAHSQLVTTDLYAVGATTFAFYCLWRFAHQRSLLNGLICALALGFSQVAKYTAVALLPLFLLSLFLYDLPALAGIVKLGVAGGIRGFFFRYAAYLAVAVATSIFVINLAFLFRGTFTQFGEYKFKSELFQDIQAKFPTLNNIPVPTPYPYLEGLDWVVQRERSGDVYGNIYLLGQIRHGEGFPGYYFIAALLKEPIATQIFVLAALGVYLFNQRRRRSFLANELFLLLPIAFFALYFNFFYRAQIGIRYYLVVFPLLFIFAGSLLLHWQRFSRAQVAAISAALVYLVASVLSYFPYYLTYFNESIGDRRYAYLYLADSNLDWGQGKFALKAYMKANPQAGFEPASIKPGWMIVSPNALVGVTRPREEYAWLRENFDPVDTIANEYLVYRISSQEFDEKCAKTGFCE